MIAQVLRKIPLINKMMINWAEKQAPEDRPSNWILDAMTQYRVEAKRSFVESEDEQEQRDNLELLQAVTMLRGRLGRSQGHQQRPKAS